MTSDEYDTITDLEERCLKTLQDDVPVAVNLMHRLVRELLDRVVIDASNAAEQAQAEERAAVVAWLRREIQKCGCDDDTASCIERGEHRTQGET
jgi:predicted neutral ceramidase superfamily lipid hydrolase